MNKSVFNVQIKLMALAVASLLLTACAAPLVKPAGVDNVRDKLTRLQADPRLATRAPVAFQEADIAVRAAEKPREKGEVADHLVFMADRSVEIAAAQAQSRLLEDQRVELSAQRERARLDSRTREADQAHNDADAAQAEANIAQREAAYARTDAVVARNDANYARDDADIARNQADIARSDKEAAEKETDELQQQIAELNAKATDRGLVVTLGDVLFDTGKSVIKGGATGHLNKLAGFLNRYQDRNVIIEGHTDNVGSENNNLDLSQRRADAVKAFLVDHGVASSRLIASGIGEGSPVADNAAAAGRQLNRRVEVIIEQAILISK